MKQFVGMIDVEPTWEILLNQVGQGILKAEFLLPAIKIADVVRQSQKQGKKQVIFSFPDKTGDVKVDVIDYNSF